ncbi:hypothetical protein N9A67_05025 [Rhodobacteraceae bacterium]|nr:hypothetical protein [Paracoccaceae bacterium]
MKLLSKLFGFGAVALTLSACGGDSVLRMIEARESTRGDFTRDGGTDAKPLTELKAGIWVDPNGCHHWIIDDGIEGYMDARRSPDGRAICDDGAAPGSIIGDYKAGGFDRKGLNY